MRRDVTEYVWEHSRQKGTRRLLLLAIAYYANERGQAFPSVTTLARRTGMTARAVQRLLPTIPKDELLVQRNGGPKGTHLFQIRMTRNLSLFPGDKAVEKGVTNCHPDKLSGDKRGSRGVTKRSKRGDNLSPEPLNQLQNRPAYNQPAAADLKFPQGTTDRQRERLLLIAREYRLDRAQLQLAFDEVDDRIERRERVDNVVHLTRAIARQIREGYFYGERADRQARKTRGGGRPLSPAEAELGAKKVA